MSLCWTWRHAILQSNLPATTRHVLLTLSCYMNDVGDGCYPTVKKLVESTGLSDRAVRSHLVSAEKHGWVRRKKHGFAGQNWANHEYEATWPGREGAAGGAGPLEEGAASGSKKVRQEVPLILPIDSSKDSIKRDWFGRFWSVFPRKVAKRGAEQAFMRAMKRCKPNVLVDRAAAYASLCEGKEARFIKHPTTWLNQGCWDDEDLKDFRAPEFTDRKWMSIIDLAISRGKWDQALGVPPQYVMESLTPDQWKQLSDILPQDVEIQR